MVKNLLAATMALSMAVFAKEHPDIVKHFIEEGVELKGSFAAPGGMFGYVGTMDSHPVVFYLTPDKEHIISGVMYDKNGNDITEEKVQKLLVQPLYEEAWQKLEKAHWIGDGNDDAPNIIYTFTDPNCPYCNKLRATTKPWLDAGKLQLRHIMVGIIREESLPKSATILASENPQQALADNRAHGIKINPQLVAKGKAMVEENEKLMHSLQISATPSSFYRDKNGKVAILQGAPRSKDDIAAIIGALD